jgi:hypothetical protein
LKKYKGNKSCWCIYDKDGVEKVVSKSIKPPKLVKNSRIYSIGNDYYFIENGYFILEWVETTGYGNSPIIRAIRERA